MPRLTALSVIAYVTWWIALVPLAWLFGLRWRGERREPQWWWLAGAFAVSWVADTAELFIAPPNQWLVSLVYPASQAAIVAAVLLNDRGEALTVVVVVSLVGIVAVLWRGVISPDVFLRTEAWGIVTGMVIDRPALGRLRATLLVTFGVGWVCWIVHVAYLALHPHLRGAAPTWYPYQASFALGIALFCWATLSPRAPLHLSRRAT